MPPGKRVTNTRMLEIRIRFFTDNLSPAGKGQVLPKHGRAAGEIRMAQNSLHSITVGEPVMFNSLLELPYKIEQLLRSKGVVLHLSDRERQYRA